MLFTTAAACILLALGPLVQARSGGYADTCHDCEIIIGNGDSRNLACICGNGRGGESTPSIRLGACIGNQGGKLVYLPK